MSGRGGEGLFVQVEGDMIEYLQNRILCNSGYSTHVHVTLVYVSHQTDGALNFSPE